MATAKTTQPFKLPVLGEDGDVDIDAELRRLDEEAARVATPHVDARHWVDLMVDPQFKKSQRAGTTLLVSGLTAAHDYLVKGALTGSATTSRSSTRPTTRRSATARSSATAASATRPTSRSATW